MRYLFKYGTLNDDGTFTMDADKVRRWNRQMITDYAELTADEKESDRKEADKFFRAYFEGRFVWSEAEQ